MTTEGDEDEGDEDEGDEDEGDEDEGDESRADKYTAIVIQRKKQRDSRNKKQNVKTRKKGCSHQNHKLIAIIVKTERLTEEAKNIP